MKVIKTIVGMIAVLSGMVGRAGDSAPFLLDTRDAPMVESTIAVTWDASWIGGDAGATVVMADNGVEIGRKTGSGEFECVLSGLGLHELTYTTLVDDEVQEEVYRVVVYKGRCTVHFDANGGTGGKTVIQGCGTELVAPTATRTGYTFAGWSPEVPVTVPAEEEVTYVAQWVVNKYAMTFDANGGAGGTTVTQNYGTELVAPTVTRPGYTFAGWLPEVPETVPADDATYTAQWVANKYSVSFDCNGGTADVYFSADGLVAFYPFDGDANDASGNGNHLSNAGNAMLTIGRHGDIDGAYYFDGSTNSRLQIDPPLVVAGNFSFALWFKTSVAMSSHGASGTAWNPGNDIIHAGFEDYDHIGVGLRVGTDGLAIVEHGGMYRPTVFSCSQSLGSDWHHVVVTVSNNNAEVVYLDGQHVGTARINSSSLAASHGNGTKAFHLDGGVGGGAWGLYTGRLDDLIVYNRALSASEVKALYDGVGDEMGDKMNIERTYGDKIGVLPTSRRSGYTFAGWFTERDGGERITEATLVPAADMELFAHWTVNKYTLTFDANGGAGGTTVTQNYGTELVAPTVMRPGYTFAGWLPEVPATVPAEDATYTVQWVANKYTMTFDANGGVDGKIATQDYGAELVAPTVTRAGYTFAGWLPEVPATVPADDATYVAQWVVNKYTITFDANGGAGGTTVTQNYGTELVAPTVTRTGYTFAGWSPEIPATVPAEDATYVARWITMGEAVGTDEKTKSIPWTVVEGDEWTVDFVTNHDGEASLTSGVLPAAEKGGCTNTTLTTTVFGEGSGSFWWKVHCEEMDEEYDEWYDYAVFSVDGEEVARIAGDSGWQKVEYEVAGNRFHVLSWTFTRDDWDEPDAEWENALWLDEFAWKKVVTLGDVASADEECAMLPWTTGGDTEWTINETTGFEHGNSAKSGVVASGQSSWIEVSVNGPGTATFMWNVQGGIYRGRQFAYATVEVDGMQQAQEYNTEGWTNKTLEINGEGTHKIRWTYLRNAAYLAEGDCAWLDGFSWTPPCGHPVTNVVNTLEATCTEAGYTGDKVCAECGEVIEAGAAIPALGHLEGANVVNARAATCTETGYTGDKVCGVCGEVIEIGSPIPALGHTEGAGVVTKAPTTTKEGVMTYYCMRCRAELRTEAIAKVIPLEIHNVVAKQRYPWNGKVDITYEAVGDFDCYQLVLSVSATNRTEGVRYVADASALSGDVGMEAGVHHVVWDMNAQGLDFESDDVVFTVAYDEVPMQYCVVDLSGGADAMNYPVAYLADVPAGGWSDEYKTTKLVLRVIAPDSPGIGDSSDATLTNPYCIGVFEVTQKQYELVTGVNPSSCRGDMRPVENLSWNTIRGDSDVYNWPATSTVDSSSFMGRIQARTGLCFDLPTEAQWEYACRAGTTSEYNNGGDSEEDLKLLGRYSGNVDDGKGGFAEHTTVGSYLPNAWGLYDMHGNAEEWCLDWYMEPFTRTMCGGSWDYPSFVCTSAFRNTRNPSAANDYNASGFRLAMTMPDPDDATETGPWHKDAHCTADSAVVAIDLRTERIAESIDISWDASWIGGDAGATVVIADNGDEIKTTTGAGVFTYSPTGLMRHELTYTTFIDGVAQDDVYRAVLLTSKLACCHSTTNVVGALAATCTETGYTGDKVCKVCGEVLESGSMIPALGHLEGDGVVTKEPTATEEGVVTYYCVRCGDVCRTEVFGEWTDPSTGYKWSYRGVGGGGVEICPAELELLDLGSMGGSGVVASSCVPTVSPWPDGHVDIPSTIAAKPVIGIGRYAFCRMGGHIGTGKFTSVTIPRGVASVGDQAFSGCGDLQRVSIPDTVTSIGDSVFVGCYALTEISVDEGNSEYKSVNGMLLTKDGSRLLQAVNGVEAIPDGVMAVDDGAFSGLDIRHLSIPASVTSIGQDMLIGCANLEGISVAAENTQYKSESGLLLTKDGKTLLQGVNGDIEVPNGVVNIADSSFFGLEGLTRITIAPGVTNIGRAVFFGCYGLTSVTIPNSVSTIGETAFEGCSPEMTVYVAVGDTDRIRGLIERSSYGGSVDFNFEEVGVYWTKIPSVAGDPGAVVTGDAESGFTVTPSVASVAVEVTIPSGVDAAKVTVEVAPTVESVKANGAAIRIVKGGHDITELLDIPAANVSGVVDMTKAAVKEAIVKEAIDKTSGAEIDLKASDPSIKTAPTRRGLTYTFSEGTTLEGMTQKAEKQGDGEPWTPTISVKGGASGFYSIGVGK